MNWENLKMELRRSALLYAKDNSLAVDESPISALLFKHLEDNFHPDSYAQIKESSKLHVRTQKAHSNVPGYLEMQSSNSSDALLMNVFCHPKITAWKGVRDLLEVSTDQFVPEFGFEAKIRLTSGGYDKTEIDMVLGDLLCEAKLTESDFTQKEASVVEGYLGAADLFHMDCLRKTEEEYGDYQVIRNLLAAIQHGKRHALICDERRPDLVRSYMETVVCLKAVQNRKRCRVVFWQELAAACGADLAQFLRIKYGI